jgi:hypothetical protein
MSVKGKKDQFWEMRSGGPYDKPGESQEIFKCVGCGAETTPKAGWNGEPDKHLCHPGCRCQSDLKIGQSRAFRNNFDRIFPNALGAGL